MKAMSLPSSQHSNSPIYMQLARRLRQQIVDGDIGAGEALPSERDLCDIMGASRVTVRKAIELLIEEGLLSRRQGSGTYVTSSIQAPGSLLSHLSEPLEARGERNDEIWTTKVVAAASEEEARLLALAAGSNVMRLRRIRMAGGQPLAIENAVVPAELPFDAARPGKSLPTNTLATHSLMFAEAAEASTVAARQRAANSGLIADLANRLRGLDPQIIFTCARGSSDHAATFAKYLFETRLRIPTVSQAPSISSLYGAPLLHMKGQPFILISQSGKSPDLLLSAQAARQAGALVIAFVNDLQSPLAQMAEIVVPLHAGPEKSVAATKSYIATLSAFAHLVSIWSGDDEMQAAVASLPATLGTAWALDWSAGVELLANAQSMFVLGRGLTLGVAQEAALKFKETSGIHAEAFSIAEVAHGPMALVKPKFPLLIFPPFDKASAGLDELIVQFAARGARIAVAGSGPPGTLPLPLPPGLHAVTAPIAMVQSFYALVNAIALRRGYDPDHPPMLQKVTETR